MLLGLLRGCFIRLPIFSDTDGCGHKNEKNAPENVAHLKIIYILFFIGKNVYKMVWSKADLNFKETK